MKKYLILIFLLLLSAPAIASLEVDDVRGYVNNERVSGVDKDGGDFDAQPGDTIDLIVRLKNNKNETIQGKIVGTIQNINENADIEKVQDFFDIEAGNDRAKTLSFVIPANARNDIFDMELKIISRMSNGTENITDRMDYDIIIDKKVKDESTSISEVLGNLTASCNLIAETTNTCFNYISTANNCSSELSTTKEERGTYKAQADECSQTKAELEQQKAQLERDISNTISIAECNNQTATAVINERRNSSDNFNQTLMIIAGAGFGYWYYTKRKKEKTSTASSYESEYFNKS